MLLLSKYTSELARTAYILRRHLLVDATGIGSGCCVDGKCYTLAIPFGCSGCCARRERPVCGYSGKSRRRLWIFFFLPWRSLISKSEIWNLNPISTLEIGYRKYTLGTIIDNTSTAQHSSRRVRLHLLRRVHLVLYWSETSWSYHYRLCIVSSPNSFIGIFW